MKFVGREKELGLLRQAWLDSANGQQQVVVLVAESRLGKTRIVQEFYQYLNQFDDPNDYWPDTLLSGNDSLHINPVFGDQKPGEPVPPWLWWGLRWTKPEQRNPGEVARCAAISDAGHLKPHLEAATRWIERKRSGRNALVGVVKTALNLAMGGVAGTAIEIFERATDWFDVHKKSAADQRSINERQIEQSESELTHLADLLLAFTSTNQIVTGGVPLILVLDDVQWTDAESLQFIQRLMRDLASRAIDHPQTPPRLLIIATCWEREWNEMSAAPISTQASSHPVSMSDALRALQVESTAKGKQGLKLTECRLGRLEASLDQIVADALPGLTLEQRALVARKAGGSPGLMSELLDNLKMRNKHLFDQSDVTRKLTALGEAALRDMSVDYHKLIEERLQDLDATEATVLRLASYIGLSFSWPLVQDLAHRIDGSASTPLPPEEVNNAFRRADHPLAIVQAIADHLDEFRLPIYRDVLRQQLKYFEDLSTCIEEHVPALIRHWLDESRLGELPEEARKAFLAFASAELNERLNGKPADESARLPLLQAWAEQISDLLMEGRIEPMKKLFDAWHEVWKTRDKENDMLIGSWRLAKVMLCAYSVDRNEATLEIANQGLSLMEREPKSTEQSEMLWILLYFAGDVVFKTGQIDESESYFSRCAVEALRAIDVFGSTAKRLRNVAISKDRVADVLLGQDKIEPALVMYRESLEIREHLLSDFGSSAERLRDVSISKDQIAGVLLRQDQVEPALALYRESLEIRERLLSEFGSSAMCLRHVAISKGRVADVLLRQNRDEPALALYRESLEISERLMSEFGSNAQRLRDVALSKDQIAKVLLNLDKVKPALALYRESLEIRERLLNEFGSNAQRLGAVAHSKYQIAGALLRQDQHGPALALYRESLKISEHLLNEFGSNAQRLKYVALLKDQITSVLLRQDQDEAVSRVP